MKTTRTQLLTTSASLIAVLVAAPLGAQTVINDGDNATVTSAEDGETISADAGVTSVVDGAPVVVVDTSDVIVDNAGTLATTGVTQTMQVNQGTTGAIINNLETGRLEADSRVVNFDGTDAALNNDGVILGTGSQRNGAVYANRTSNNIAINNSATGSIDAGVEGAGIAIEVGGGGAPRGGAITNAGTIQGRGQASAMGGTAGDGIRFFGPGLAPEYVYEGDITNSGLINSESTQGTVAGIRFANRIGFQGTLTNEEGGVISGAQNGLYFGNDADHTGGVVDNLGTISSDSRALNIDGIGLTVNNSGSILGTGNQRNGTVYADSTAQGFTLNNAETGVIDAGEGNEGAGFSVELASAETGGNAFDIVNAGTIQGRGNASAGATGAGDGLRFERTRIDGALEGSTDGLFVGNITNSGTIASEAANGTAGGIRFVNGVSFQGVLDNSGTISGVQNGLYFGNPTPAGGGDFSQAIVNNSGTISSGSRALNIDGIGLTVNNLAGGQILGLGDQRNGTVYADGTADAFTFINAGTVDAGAGNQGSGFGAEVGGAADGANTFTLTNTGTIQGRGQAGPMENLAGDGVRIGNAGNTGTFDGVITNSGLINSESTQGPVSGLRVVNGVDFTGELTNSGTISGGNHGLYLGAGDHSAAVITNSGTLSGGVNAFFAGNATVGVNVINDGGTLIGDFVGSAFDDTLALTGASNLIQGDILNGVAVTTAVGSSTTFVGARSLSGDFTHNGALEVDLGTDSLAVDGNTVLGAGSLFNIATDDIRQPEIGTTFDVLTETGSFTDNGTIVNVVDNDFLIDFAVNLGSVQVTAVAADLGNVSTDANISSFGSALTSAAAGNRLAAGVFTPLNDLTSAADFEAAALTLLPAINDGVYREIYEGQRLASANIQGRVRSKSVGVWGAVQGRDSDADGSSQSSLGYDASSAEFTLGVDTKVGETTTLGVLFNWSDIDANAEAPSGAESEIDAFQIGGYAGFELGKAYITAELGYTTASVDASREAFRFNGPRITSESDVDGVYAAVNASTDLDAGALTVTPSVGLRYADLSRDTFTETGALGLTIDTDSAEFIEARIGARVAKTGEEGFLPFVSVDYAYDFAADPIALAGSFNGGADAFRVVADGASASRFDVSAGFDFVTDGATSIGAEYRGRFASDYQSHSGGVRLRFAF